jgi:hypothetical protein
LFQRKGGWKVIRDHRFYEMQSALSATGHLAGSELEELEQHVSQCVSCRNYMVEMATVSRELFLTQIRPNSCETPKGMEQRFIQRAVAAGIPLKPETSAGFSLQFARYAAIVAVLTLFIAAAWKVASTSHAERASGQFPPQIEARPEAISDTAPQLPGVVHTAVVNSRRTKRRPAVPGRAVLTRSPISYGDVSHPYLALNGPLFTKPYAASLFRREWDGKPEERSFHFDLTLASLPRSDSPLNAGASALVPDFRFNTPVFHIDPRQSW